MPALLPCTHTPAAWFFVNGVARPAVAVPFVLAVMLVIVSASGCPAP